jgi:N-acetylmuramoyl-L-alanine amidase
LPAELRRGSRGEAVRDLQQRLSALGHDVGADEPGDLGDATDVAVRALQDTRGLRVDGIVGRQTWSALVESGFSLGDRLLYLRRPMLRGDDVVELQQRLNGLGFDAGREDGILGDDTNRALGDFQRAAGLAADSICGSVTIAALARVSSFAEGSVAAVREREELLAHPRRLADRRVYLLATPGLAALGEQVARGLLEAGADAVLDASGDEDSLVASAANRFGADLFLALRLGDDAGCRCAYFASGRFRSETGHAVASAIHVELAPVLPATTEVCGKAYAVLRETRMPAVVCELVPQTDVEAMRSLVLAAGDVGRAIVRGVRRGIEEPAVD